MLPAGAVPSEKAALNVRMVHAYRSDFPTVINIFVSVIQEHIEIRSRLF